MNIVRSLMPIWKEPAKHLYRCIREPEYRYYYWLMAKYGGTPRYQKSVVSLHGWTLDVPDVASFLSAYREIFVEGIYSFESGSDQPVILDCGANIGLSVLYFRRAYPKAQIVAYEADPAIFSILRSNLDRNGIRNVELHNEAIWSTAATLDFSVEGADGGRVNTGKDTNIISVPSVALSSIIRDRLHEFVKLDIEGAEVEALKDCEPYLSGSTYFFVEFHSFQDKKQQLGQIIDLFERCGFRVHIHPPFIAKRPFLGIVGSGGMDMQLNLFFWKARHEAP